jgi:hypothetical protein
VAVIDTSVCEICWEFDDSDRVLDSLFETLSVALVCFEGDTLAVLLKECRSELDTLILFDAVVEKLWLLVAALLLMDVTLAVTFPVPPLRDVVAVTECDDIVIETEGDAEEVIVFVRFDVTAASTPLINITNINRLTTPTTVDALVAETFSFWEHMFRHLNLPSK